MVAPAVGTSTLPARMKLRQLASKAVLGILLVTVISCGEDPVIKIPTGPGPITQPPPSGGNPNIPQDPGIRFYVGSDCSSARPTIDVYFDGRSVGWIRESQQGFGITTSVGNHVVRGESAKGSNSTGNAMSWPSQTVNIGSSGMNYTFYCK